MCVNLCVQTWRADLHGPVAPQTRGPSSTLLCPEMAACLQPPPVLWPGSDKQKMACRHKAAVAVETLKEKHTI